MDKTQLTSNPLSVICIQYHKTPIGELVLGSFGEALCLLDFRYRKMRAIVDRRIQRGIGVPLAESDSLVLRKTRHQLTEYLRGERKRFDIPLLLVGSDFQKQVWHELMQIPYGQTTTYRRLATKIGHSQAARAVAGANGANAIALIVPCHRVLGNSGALTGYGGGLTTKKRLLTLEREISLPLGYE